MPADPRFSGPSPDLIRIEPLGVLTACYDRLSGRTHLLVEPAPEILALLAERAMTHGELLAELSARYDLAEEDGGIEAALSARLAELIEAGLAVELREKAAPDA